MVRTRILAAVFALSFTACEAVDSDTTPVGNESIDSMETVSLANVEQALSVLPKASVVGRHADGVPFMIKGQLGTAGQSLRGVSASMAGQQVSAALGTIAPVFGLKASDLVVTRTTVDELGHTHLRFNQVRNGLQVVGRELIVHVDERGEVYAANGSARGGGSLTAQARISAESAGVAAVRETRGSRLAVESSRLVYYSPTPDGHLELAYETVVTGEGVDLPIRDHVFVSATRGSILGRASDIHTALNRAVYTANNGTSLPGTLKRGEGAAASGDSHVDVNYDHLGTTYNCYKTNFNRDSFNNAGAQLKSTVHYSSNYVNAFWNGTQMVYGDGDNVDSGPLGKSLDVTVHELTHAVTSSESNLTYSNESGALNEGMSDIFAAYCESWTKAWSTEAAVWMIGDDIWTPATAGDALRYMANPTQDGSSKDYYPERYTGTSDNGGVHWNSGIANLAFKLLSTGGTHPRGKTTTTVTGIGVQKAGAIFYKANVDLMTASTTFAQAKTYTEQAAEALYGAGTAEVTSTTNAWLAVGVGGGTTPPPTGCTTPVALSNGVAKTGISVATGAWSCDYTLVVPSGATNLKFDMSGGTGDADMYVKFGSAPTSSSYDCRPYKSGNAESCPITTAQAGTYYVKVYGYSAPSGVSLVGSYTGGSGGGNVLTNAVETASYSGAAASWTCWTLSVPAGKTSLVFNQTGKTGTTGDADLYVKLGSAPTTSSYTCRPYLGGSTETCTINAPASGTWYACSYGYNAYSAVTMKGTY